MTEEELAKENYIERTFAQKFLELNKYVHELNTCKTLTDIFKMVKSALKGLF